MKENYNQRNLEGYPRMLCHFSNKESQLITANPRKLNIQTIENNDNQLNILIESPLVIINYTGKVYLLGHIKLTIPIEAKEEKVSIDYSQVNIEFIINQPKNIFKLPVFNNFINFYQKNKNHLDENLIELKQQEERIKAHAPDFVMFFPGKANKTN